MVRGVSCKWQPIDVVACSALFNLLCPIGFTATVSCGAPVVPQCYTLLPLNMAHHDVSHRWLLWGVLPTSCLTSPISPSTTLLCKVEASSEGGFNVATSGSMVLQVIPTTPLHLRACVRSGAGAASCRECDINTHSPTT